MTEESGGHIPRRFIHLVEQFVRGRRTGQVEIEFKKGQIMGCRTQEFHPLEPGPSWQMLQPTPERLPAGLYRVDDGGQIEPVELTEAKRGRASA